MTGENNIGRVISKPFGKKYKIVKGLRSCDHSDIYLCTESDSGKRYAVELFGREQVEKNGKFYKKFFADIKKIVHPNIINVVDSGMCKDDFFVVKEYFEGSFILSEWTGEWERYKRPWRDVLSDMKQILSGVDYARKSGVSCGWLIFENIRRNNFGTIKIDLFDGNNDPAADNSPIRFFGEIMSRLIKGDDTDYPENVPEQVRAIVDKAFASGSGCYLSIGEMLADIKKPVDNLEAIRRYAEKTGASINMEKLHKAMDRGTAYRMKSGDPKPSQSPLAAELAECRKRCRELEKENERLRMEIAVLKRRTVVKPKAFMSYFKLTDEELENLMHNA